MDGNGVCSSLFSLIKNFFSSKLLVFLKMLIFTVSFVYIILCAQVFAECISVHNVYAIPSEARKGFPSMVLNHCMGTEN